MGTTNREMPVALKESIVRAANNTAAGFTHSLKTEYTLSHNGGKPVRVTAQCFGGLATNMRTNKYDPKHTVLRYLPVETTLPVSTCLRWLALCQRVGIIPADKDPKVLFYHGLTIDLGDDNLSPFGFYLQVAFYRYMREVTRLVENVLDLVDNGADFWAAFTFTHDLNVNNPAHSLCPTKTYKGPGRDDLSLAISMNRFTGRKAVIDTRKLWEVINQQPETIPWEIHKNILSLGFGSICVAKPDQILDPHLIPLLRSDSKEELLERVENLKEECNHIQFVEKKEPTNVPVVPQF